MIGKPPLNPRRGELEGGIPAQQMTLSIAELYELH
jgi:hypothetical protein